MITRELAAAGQPGDVVNLSANWRLVPGYPDYSVSDLGQVVSRRRGVPRLLRGCLSANGYRSVWLCNGHGRKQVGIHRVVLLAFVGPCPPEMEGRHLDDDSSNNRLSNLAYGTHGDNMKDQVANGVHAEAAKTRCPQDHPYDERNTLWWSGGRGRPPGRRCRACEVTRQSRRNRQEVAA